MSIEAVVDTLFWFVIIASSFAILAGVIKTNYATRQHPRRHAMTPKHTPTLSQWDQGIWTTKPVVEVTVEFGRTPPGPGILIIAARQALNEDGKRYKLLSSRRFPTKKTFYFEEV